MTRIRHRDLSLLSHLFSILLTLIIISVVNARINVRGKDYYVSGDSDDSMLFRAKLRHKYDNLADKNNQEASIEYYGYKNVLNSVQSIESVVIEREINKEYDDDPTTQVVHVDNKNRPTMFMITKTTNNNSKNLDSLFVMRIEYLNNNRAEFTIERGDNGKTYQVTLNLQNVLGVTTSSNRRRRTKEEEEEEEEAQQEQEQQNLLRQRKLRRKVTRRVELEVQNTCGLLAAQSSEPQSSEAQSSEAQSSEPQSDGGGGRRKRKRRKLETDNNANFEDIIDDVIIQMGFEVKEGRKKRQGYMLGMRPDNNNNNDDGLFEFMVPVATQNSLNVVVDACIPAAEEIDTVCNKFENTLSLRIKKDRSTLCDAIVRSITVKGKKLKPGTGEGRPIKRACARVLEETHNACQIIEPQDSDDSPIDLETDLCNDNKIIRLPNVPVKADKWELTPRVLYPPDIWDNNDMKTDKSNVPDDGGDVYVYEYDLGGGAGSGGGNPSIESVKTKPSNPQPKQGYKVEAVVSCLGRDEHIQMSWVGEDGYRDTKFCYYDDDDNNNNNNVQCTLEVAGAKKNTEDEITVTVTRDQGKDLKKSLTVVH